MVVAPTFHRFVRFALLLALTSTVSCSRERYRVQADREVEYLVTEKSSDPRWGLVGFNIGMDPRSRYYDPYPIDRTPMPQRRSGLARVHARGRWHEGLVWLASLWESFVLGESALAGSNGGVRAD